LTHYKQILDGLGRSVCPLVHIFDDCSNLVSKENQAEKR
jgi:hypothetical protein